VTRKAFEKRSLVRENRLLHRELERHDRYKEFIGESKALRSVLEMIDRVSQTDSTVLIQGESGVGKELAARAIYRNSLRARQPFIVVDCTSLQESLLQSELFGHERGAFTGAVSRKHGLFEVADGGTMFLDEIGEVSLPLQARVLRVLDTGTNLYQMVQKEQFRQDLYYRINVISFTLPPLRERPEDVAPLSRYFAERSPVARSREIEFSRETLALLREYSWPGNVRELQNVIERALILADNDLVSVEDLPISLRQGLPVAHRLTADRPTLAELEKSYITLLLDEFDGHRARVAELLGISERTLYRKRKDL
jgi:DNA-binding NtrC family response regulator